MGGRTVIKRSNLRGPVAKARGTCFALLNFKAAKAAKVAAFGDAPKAAKCESDPPSKATLKLRK
eukprot:4566013-Prymnesium_polylepis.1